MVTEYYKSWWEANKERRNAQARERYRANAEERRAKQRAWYAENKEVADAQKKKWCENKPRQTSYALGN